MAQKLLSVYFIFLSFNAFSTHERTMELYYKWKQDSTYEFTLILYRPCESKGVSNSITIGYNSISLSVSDDFNLNLIPSDSNILPEILIIPFDCGNPDSICWKRNVYRGEWTSPGGADDWTFVCHLSKRLARKLGQYSIANFYEFEDIWLQCGLNNLDFPDSQAKNNAPFWNNPLPNISGHLNDTIINYPVNTLCRQKNYNLDQSVVEYQGDSIVYEFFHPQIEEGDTVSYLPPYSFQDPIPHINSNFGIDPYSGMISLTPGVPMIPGYFVLGIQASEYRNGMKIGYVRRELTLHITDSMSTGIEEKSAIECSIYPNPASDRLYLDVRQISEPGSVVIYNLFGQRALENKIVSGLNTLHVQNLPAGVYLFVVMEEGSGVFYHRIIVE